jgi:hypothetical protein
LGSFLCAFHVHLCSSNPCLPQGSQATTPGGGVGKVYFLGPVLKVALVYVNAPWHFGNPPPGGEVRDRFPKGTTENYTEFYPEFIPRGEARASPRANCAISGILLPRLSRV